MAHALVGAAIASKIPDPVIGLPLALTSHFIMDSIPHWDFGTDWRKRPKYITGIASIADTLIGITVAYLLFQGKVSTVYLLLAVFFSLIPDWMETPWYIFFAQSQKQKPAASAGLLEKIAFRVYKLENTFHTKTSFPFGLFTSLATLTFFLMLLR